MVLSTGCMTFPDASGLKTNPVVPAANEQVTLDQLVILVDATDSMSNAPFQYEKQLVDAFVGAMPDGSYEAGINSFSGLPCKVWVRNPLAPYDRNSMVKNADRIVLLGSTTPMSKAIKCLTQDVQGKQGNGALLVFSDGGAIQHGKVLDACKAMKAAHKGQFCIYTVQIGDCPRGKDLLEKMVATAGCGKSWNGSELNSVGAIDKMVRTIFFGPKQAAPAPSAPGPQVARTAILLNNVLFDLDKSILKPEGKVEVDKLIAEMKAHPKDTVLIEGHTCDLASDAYNMGLGQRRADSIKTYMTEKGIDVKRMSTKSFGETTPAVPNSSEENRKLNRRGEFKITIAE